MQSLETEVTKGFSSQSPVFLFVWYREIRTKQRGKCYRMKLKVRYKSKKYMFLSNWDKL